MSAVKFSQIQDTLISLSTRINRLDSAVKDLGLSVSDALSRVSELEEKEKEKDAVKAGSWVAVPAGESDTPLEGEIYVLANDAPLPEELEDEEGGDTPIGGATYTLKIDKIPSYVPTKDTAETPSYKFVFTPSSDFDFTPITDEWPEIKVSATQEDNNAALEYTLTYEMTDNNEKNFILTLTTGAADLIFGDSTAEPPTETKPITISAVPETSIPREEPVQEKKSKKF